MAGMLLFVPSIVVSLRVASGAQVGVVAALALLAAISVGPRPAALLRSPWLWGYLIVLSATLLGTSSSSERWVSVLDHSLGALAVLLSLSALINTASGSVGGRLGAVVRLPGLGRTLGEGLATLGTLALSRPAEWPSRLAAPVPTQPGPVAGVPSRAVNRADWLAAALGWLLATILLIVHTMPGTGR